MGFTQRLVKNLSQCLSAVDLTANQMIVARTIIILPVSFMKQKTTASRLTPRPATSSVLVMLKEPKEPTPLPNYNYSMVYNTPEAVRQVAERFLIDHKDILGIDITKMTYKFEGTKPGNFFMHWTGKNVSVTKEHEVCGDVDPTLKGVYKDEQGALCVKQKSTNYHQVDITITNGGQIIIYRSNINDLNKL